MNRVLVLAHGRRTRRGSASHASSCTRSVGRRYSSALNSNQPSRRASSPGPRRNRTVARRLQDPAPSQRARLPHPQDLCGLSSPEAAASGGGCRRLGRLRRAGAASTSCLPTHRTRDCDLTPDFWTIRYPQTWPFSNFSATEGESP